MLEFCRALLSNHVRPATGTASGGMGFRFRSIGYGKQSLEIWFGREKREKAREFPNCCSRLIIVLKCGVWTTLHVGARWRPYLQREKGGGGSGGQQRSRLHTRPAPTYLDSTRTPKRHAKTRQDLVKYLFILFCEKGKKRTST